MPHCAHTHQIFPTTFSKYTPQARQSKQQPVANDIISFFENTHTSHTRTHSHHPPTHSYTYSCIHQTEISFTCRSSSFFFFLFYSYFVHFFLLHISTLEKIKGFTERDFCFNGFSPLVVVVVVQWKEKNIHRSLVEIRKSIGRNIQYFCLSTNRFA